MIDAALRRAGILRVGGLDELFDAAEITSRFPPLPNDRIGIVTNGGGAGVLALDQLIDSGGVPAELAPATLTALGGALPPTWSHANPVDIIGDAPAERYRAAVTAVACQIASNRDRLFACKNGSDSFLLLFCDGLMQCLRQEHRMAVRFGFASLISPELAATLQTKNIAAEIPSTCSITWITYGGDEAGIDCRLDFAHEPETATFASITHLRFDARLPLARDIAVYKKHRVKRLRRQPA